MPLNERRFFLLLSVLTNNEVDASFPSSRLKKKKAPLPSYAVTCSLFAGQRADVKEHLSHLKFMSSSHLTLESLIDWQQCRPWKSAIEPTMWC